MGQLSVKERLLRLVAIEDEIATRTARERDIIADASERMGMIALDVTQRYGFEDMATLLASIKASVIEAGESVKVPGKEARYYGGRESVSVLALKGYGAAHPEVLAFISMGDPYVSFRAAPKDGE